MQTLSLMHAVTMDITALGGGGDTATLSLIQDKAVVALMDRGSLDMVVVVLMDTGSLILVTIGQAHLEHKPLEGV